MGFIDKLKESLGGEGLNKEQITQSLQEIKEQLEEEEKANEERAYLEEQRKNNEWAEKVVKAQSNITARNRRRINSEKLKRISPSRQVLLKKLGKI